MLLLLEWHHNPRPSVDPSQQGHVKCPSRPCSFATRHVLCPSLLTLAVFSLQKQKDLLGLPRFSELSARRRGRDMVVEPLVHKVLYGDVLLLQEGVADGERQERRRGGGRWQRQGGHPVLRGS